MKKFVVLSVLGVLFLASSVFSADRQNEISFTGWYNAEGQFCLKLSEDWRQDPDIAAFEVYSMPSNTLLWCALNRDLPKSVMNQFTGKKARSMTVGFGHVSVQLSGVGDIFYDEYFLVKKILLPKTFAHPDTLYGEDILRLKVDADEFSFTVIYNDANRAGDPYGTGCWTYGRCGDGPWIYGPWCEDCAFRLCCCGDTGFIDCDWWKNCPLC